MCYESDLLSSDTLRQALRRLPLRQRERWTEHAMKLRRNKEPTLHDLERWLAERVRAMSDPLLPDDDTGKSRPSKPTAFGRPSPPTKYTTLSTTVKQPPPQPERPHRKITCPDCQQDHRLFKCDDFKSKSMGHRVQLVKDKALCANCLRPGHFFDNCSTPRRCKHDACGRKHHTLLHGAPSITDATTTVKIASPLCAAIRANSATVYLQIARVKVYAPNGKTTNTYALLDNGSQTTLIRQDVADRLQLSGFPDTLTLGTVNGESVLRSTQRVKFKVGPTGSTGTYDVPWAWTVPRLGVPAQKIGDKIHNTTFEHLDGLTFPNVKSQEI